MFKVQYGKEVRIFQNAEKIKLFSHLKVLVKGKFIGCPESFAFTFIDEEGDKITVQTDIDLECFISLVCQNRKTKNLLKLNLHPIQQNQFQQDQEKIQSHLQEVDLQSQPSSYHSEAEKQVQQNNRFEQVRTQQFQDLNQSEQIEYLEQQTIYGQQQLYQLIKANLKLVQEKIIENTLDQTYNQLIKEEVQVYLDRDFQYIAENPIETQKALPSCLNNQQISDIEDESQLEQLIEKTLLKQMPSFIEQLTRRTCCSVKLILSTQNIKTSLKQKLNPKTTLLL